MDIGRELKMLRQQAGLTQENVQDLLFVDQSIISRIENGHIDISAREYFRWKNFYESCRKVGSFVIDPGQTAASGKI